MSVRIILFCALVLVLLGAAPHAARGQSGRYIDDDRSRFEGFIESASEAGVVAGCNPPANDRFCPHRAVTRAEMAMMLGRVVDLPAPKANVFEDDDGLTAEPAINSLARAGVTRGCGKKAFCPFRSLTRGEMASLISGALGIEPVDPAASRYVDLGESPHGSALTALAVRDGIFPCDPPEGRRLCPGSPVSRDEAVFALTRALELRPHKPTGTHTGPKLGFLDSFDTLRLWDGRSPSSRNRVRLTDDGYRGSGLEVGIPRGSHFGADFKLDLDKVVGEEPETLFFRYFLRLDPGWNPQVSGKLPGFSGIYNYTGKGGYRSSPSAPGWSARLKFNGNRPDDPRARLGYYVYHLGQERRYGDQMNWNEAGKLIPGEWYCIEGQVELNNLGVADGALRAWVDGTPAFEAAGIQFRRPSEPELKIESFWFDVYYGGKPVAPRDMGLTVDEVAVDGRRIGCGAGSGIERKAIGDLNGDGFNDRVWWGACDAHPCFQSQLTSHKGLSAVRTVGDGAWFSLETHRLGIETLDIDGDGDEDILYRGRCGRGESTKCWRVHRVNRNTVGPGEDWGDGAWFSGASRFLVTGDWDGNGRGDVTYAGLCGSGPPQPCWRTHLNAENRFADAAGWGAPAKHFASIPEAADLTGDGKDDILYAAPCGENTCWQLQAAEKGRFGKPVIIGRARDAELEQRLLFDFTGDGREDLLTVKGGKTGSVIEVREMSKKGLGKPKPLVDTANHVTEISLRRTGGTPAVEAVLWSKCKSSPQGCPSSLLGFAGKLVTEEQYDRAMLVRLMRRLNRPIAPNEIRYN